MIIEFEAIEEAIKIIREFPKDPKVIEEQANIILRYAKIIKETHKYFSESIKIANKKENQK
jgi:hypothetical protein